jgi:cytidylate kinase
MYITEGGPAMREIFSIDSAISYQENNWKHKKKTVSMTEKESLPFITISREYGCLGYQVGVEAARLLNGLCRPDQQWAVFERRILDRVMEDMHISRELAETLTDRGKSFMADYFRITFSNYPPEAAVYTKLVETIRLIAANGHAVIIGRVGNVITRDMPRGYHVRLIASPEKKIENIGRQFKIPVKKAKEVLAKKGEAREEFILKRLKVDMADPQQYGLVINTSDLSIEATARLIVKGMEYAGLARAAC